MAVLTLIFWKIVKNKYFPEIMVRKLPRGHPSQNFIFGGTHDMLVNYTVWFSCPSPGIQLKFRRYTRKPAFEFEKPLHNWHCKEIRQTTDSKMLKCYD